jgi:hypothetical protein
MPTILGSGEHRYRVVENWAKLPPAKTPMPPEVSVARCVRKLKKI